MLRRTSTLRTNSILKPISLFYNNYYNNEKSNNKNSNNENKDLTEMMNDGIRKSIEIAKMKDQDVIIKKYLKYQEDQEEDYQVINNFLNFNHTNYFFFILSFLAGYHFRYFIERNKNT